MSTQFLIPIFMFGCITYVAKQLIDARMRILMLRAGGSDDLIRSILEGEALQRRYASLRSGITLIALAAGFALIDLFGSRDITPGAIAVLAAAGRHRQPRLLRADEPALTSGHQHPGKDRCAAARGARPLQQTAVPSRTSTTMFKDIPAAVREICLSVRSREEYVSRSSPNFRVREAP